MDTTRLSLTFDRKKKITDKQKLKEFGTTRLALQQMLKNSPKQNRKGHTIRNRKFTNVKAHRKAKKKKKSKSKTVKQEMMHTQIC